MEVEALLELTEKEEKTVPRAAVGYARQLKIASLEGVQYLAIVTALNKNEY